MERRNDVHLDTQVIVSFKGRPYEFIKHLRGNQIRAGSPSSNPYAQGMGIFYLLFISFQIMLQYHIKNFMHQLRFFHQIIHKECFQGTSAAEILKRCDHQEISDTRNTCFIKLLIAAGICFKKRFQVFPVIVTFFCDKLFLECIPSHLFDLLIILKLHVLKLFDLPHIIIAQFLSRKCCFRQPLCTQQIRGKDHILCTICSNAL